jgi:glutaredoxin
MNRIIQASSRPTLAFYALLVTGVVLLAAGQAQAQTIYRVVGADGKVTFSDQPPAPSAQVTATTAAGQSLSDANTGAALPFALRQVVSQYPVTLYSAGNCGPCDSGRALLRTRGTPFTEKTVTTNDDAQALKRISGESTLPFLTIGSQQIKGYSELEWTQFLNAAGYPQTSALPAGYRNPPATPLVAAQKAAPPAPAPAETPFSPTEPSPPADPSANPAGIKF